MGSQNCRLPIVMHDKSSDDGVAGGVIQRGMSSCEISHPLARQGAFAAAYTHSSRLMTPVNRKVEGLTPVCGAKFSQSLKQPRFRVNHLSIMSAINQPPVDPLHVVPQASVEGPRKKVSKENKTTNRLKDQAKLSKTMKTQSDPSRRG